MYISTRGNCKPCTAAQAIALGMVPGGGLFVPESIPKIDLDVIKNMVGQSYQDIAKWILGQYLDDYTVEEIAQCVNDAYNDQSFDHKDIAPLVKVEDHVYILELWHGPTAAFKDMALQLTPRLLAKAMEKMALSNEVVILVATSGDTGKAALEGFKNVHGTKIIVFYPADGVSKVQEMQMLTTDGDNTFVVAVDGNFDDCQSAVKDIFGNEAFNQQLLNHGYQFSSANSINWGRLLPQIVYYFASYLNLVRDNQLTFGEEINFVVPTGNFGNILAGWYAQQMGLPIHKLVCASNENNVLTDFFANGVYDRNRTFVQTNSPSMDILISSNLERFLYAMCQQDGQQIAQWMSELKDQGVFTVDQNTKQRMDQFVVGGFADEAMTLETIKSYFEQHQYLLDTHTAVAMNVYQQYKEQAADPHLTVIDSTANPYKFVASVYSALTNQLDSDIDELDLLDQLQQLSGMMVHRGLQRLDQKIINHDRRCQANQLEQVIADILNLG